MSEYHSYYTEPTLPYATVYFSTWCRENGVEEDQFSQALKFGGFMVARLQSKELEEQTALREMIEADLPLADAKRVDDPHLFPEFWGTQPKVYEAPEGFAFEMVVEPDEDFNEYYDYDYAELDDSGHYRLVAEYLKIDTYQDGGKAQARIELKERPKNFALPVMHDGNPDKGGTIRLPSRLDPEKDGAYVTFARHQGWEIVEEPSGRLRGLYGNVSVQLIPFERPPDDEVYVADFGKYNDFPLDEFLFRDETLIFPEGFRYVRQRNGEFAAQYMPASRLILPPMTDVESIWDIVRFNKSIDSKMIYGGRFHYLRFDERRFLLDFETRKFNTMEKRNKAFMHALVIEDPGYSTTLKDILKVALSDIELDDEDAERFG